MGKKLVIVESPAKGKTIEKYLGKDYQVLASYGHVRDLLAKTGAVDPDNDFAMNYVPIDRNQKHVTAIIKALKPADTLYLATDPDREGEAISWHLYEMLQEKGLLKDKEVHRVVFYEVTKKAIVEAFDSPRELSTDLINAQQARRALDHLVGFNLSPLLWKKVRRGLSAGRVQSPALSMIVTREEEIEKFVAQEYWTVEADCAFDQQKFDAKLFQWEGSKLEQFSITTGEAAEAIKQAILERNGKQLTVTKVEKKQRKRNPAAPFITSTLQQEAARKLGFTTKRTMRVAQQLYEGVHTDEGLVGLITYMRTDSVSLSNDAIAEVRELIQSRFGADALPGSPRVFKTKSKNAQEAHEAVRPTSVVRTPEAIGAHLNDEQLKLYRLIWQRTVASQMVHATINTVSVDISVGGDDFLRATGSTIAKPGFMALYAEGKDDAAAADDDEKRLPVLAVGDEVDLLGIRNVQHFTEPPPRYTEASLVKALEEHGIGRPSTYASIISTLQSREYALLEKKRFFATDVGRIVNRFLTQYFEQYVDYGFTARLEDELDSISRGERDWVPLLASFWSPFHKQVEDVDASVKRSDVTDEDLDEECPKCGKGLSVRLGKRGRFIGCKGYPDCDYTRNLGDDEEGDAPDKGEPEVVEGRECPKCSSPLHVKMGRYGKFIGCSGYPKCRHMEPLVKPKETGVSCPNCKEGSILERKSRYGKIFYSCDTYPKCQYAVWNLPINESCPTCKWPILTVKTTKRRGTEKVCPQKECDFAVPAPELAPEEDKHG